MKTSAPLTEIILEEVWNIENMRIESLYKHRWYYYRLDSYN